MENLIWFCDYLVYNNNGLVNDTVNVFGTLLGLFLANGYFRNIVYIGALFTSLKSTLIRDALLLCALGYSITKPVLRKRVIVGVVILSLAYFAVVAVTQYLLVLTLSLNATLTVI